MSQETRLKRNHITLMKHPETAWYSGIMMMGENEVIDKEVTAYTDGVNKRYGRKFMESIKDEAQVRGLIMHENLHVALKHIPRNKDLWKENSKLANASADYVVNDIIESMKDKAHIKLPDGALYHPMFHNWSLREIYTFLKKNAKGGGNGGGDGEGGTGIKNSGSADGDFEFPTDSLDEHDWESQELSIEEAKKLEEKIDKSLREGGIMAGRMGAKVPRSISDLLEPKIDWREVLREFVSSATKGKDEFTWRKFNKRMLANDMYLPSLENESIGEIVVAIDTSGSIGQIQLNEFASELASICETCSPEVVRVLWWDTSVHGEQVFKGDYTNIASMLKPEGFGGTHVSCVNKYVMEKGIKAECVLVFTDGYVEHDIEWQITAPTLWMVTENKAFEPPTGKLVLINKE
jgi:predicted metal-dependent peptidase